MISTRALPREFGRWTLLCTLCALPSFIIALLFEFDSGPQVVAMVCGVATFIPVFAVAASLRWYRLKRGTVLGRALRAGTKVRVGISLLALLMLTPALWKYPADDGVFLQVNPDFWCGYAAAMLLDQTGVGLDLKTVAGTYALTVTEGAILTLTLGGLSLLAYIPISMRPTEHDLPKVEPGAGKIARPNPFGLDAGRGGRYREA